MSDTANPNADSEELAEKIKGIRIAMVTLPDADDVLRGRPLTVQENDFDGTLWFLVSKSAEWTSGISAETQANVALVDTSDGTWVSIAGAASLHHDAARIKDMWSRLYESWFEGPEDPDLTLLRFDAHSADYWDSSSNRIVRLANLIRSAVKGEPEDLGDRGTLSP